MENDLRQLYQDLILEHARQPRNFGLLEGANRHAHGHNPLCGDEVTVYLDVKKDVVENIRFQGQGCAISTAAASVMTELAKGQKLEDLNILFKQFHQCLMGEATSPQEATQEKLPRKLQVFTGVKAYPMRVKCATLAWHTLQAALKEKTEAVTTE